MRLPSTLLGLLLLPGLARAQCPDGTPPPCSSTRLAAATPGANSVGVLLFNNLTHDSSSAYLSDGLASEISTSLARIPRLEVRSPGAVRSAQRNMPADPSAIGRRLNVRYVVEGEYQRGGDRIRVAVRLVTVANGTQRWGDAWTRPADDLLAVQEEIAGAVATAIAGQLLPQERTVLAARPTRNPEAYDHVLRGNFQLAKRSPSGTQRAIEEYSAALRLDPSYAVAYARIALGYALFLDWSWDYPGVPRDSQLARGQRASDRALELDSTSAEMWMSRGLLLAASHPRDFAGAPEALQRATTLEPHNAEIWHQLGSVLLALGRLDESVPAMRRSLALEPGRPISWMNLGASAEMVHRYGEARAAYDSSLAADPDFYAAYTYRSMLRWLTHDLDGAEADAREAMRTMPPGEAYFGHVPMAMVAAARGDTAAARAHMNQAMPAAGGTLGAYQAAIIANGFVAMGRYDEAMDCLERGHPLGANLWFGMALPEQDALRSNPRFQRLMDAVRPPGARDPQP